MIPVGEQTQILKIITRKGDNFDERQIEAVRFVPLVPGAVSMKIFTALYDWTLKWAEHKLAPKNLSVTFVC